MTEKSPGSNFRQWSTVIERYLQFLTDYIEPDFGLLDKLYSNAVISVADRNVIKAETTVEKRNAKLLEIIRKPEKYDDLIEALNSSNQTHISNFLKEDGKQSTCDDWPLGDREDNVLRINFEILIELIIIKTDGLLDRMHGMDVINKRQKDFVCAKQTPSEKNEALLEILQRRSIRDYKETIGCLKETNQHQIARLFEKGGGIVPIHVVAKGEPGAIKYIVDVIEDILAKKPLEECGKILKIVQGKIAAVKLGHTVVLYDYLQTIEQLTQLRKSLEFERLKLSIRLLFNKISSPLNKVDVSEVIVKDYELKRVEMFFQGDSGNSEKRKARIFSGETSIPTKDDNRWTSQAPMDRILSKYIHGNDVYAKIRNLLSDEMDKGLSASTNAEATVKMFPSYVQALPNGTERGDYLALDFGGQTFRVLHISLQGASVQMQSEFYQIPESLMLGTGDALFDYIADCIANFVNVHNLKNKKVPLGFTFSFPCRQTNLNVGEIVSWTKGFICEEIVGKDVVSLLHEALERQGCSNVQCVALLNDTVGSFMSCAFEDNNTEVGVVLDTGTNACYMEKLNKVELLDKKDTGFEQVIVNTEWGAFGDNECLNSIRTEADKAIDKSSLNPGKQTFEKMISGMYMGEIVRHVMMEAIREKALFGGLMPEKLPKENSFNWTYISTIEHDDKVSMLIRTRQILRQLGVQKPTMEDCLIVRQICAIVSQRAAYLAAAGIAALVNRIGKPDITVAISGNVYRQHPHFPTLISTKTRDLIKPGLQVDLKLSEDGSGKGAALVAAVAHRLKHTPPAQKT